MDVQLAIDSEIVEEMLAIGVDRAEFAAVEEPGAVFEAAVRSLDGDDAPGERLGLSFCPAVKLISFRHYS